MSKSYRRYEILLPLAYNDGSPIPDSLIGTSLLELRARFGAISCETQTIQGAWSHLGQVYRDDLVRVYVDVEDTSNNQQFVEQFKEQMKTRFRQLEIWVVSYPIRIH